MYKLYYLIQNTWRGVNATKTIHDQMFNLSKTIGIGSIVTEDGMQQLAAKVNIATIPIDTYKKGKLVY